MHLQSVKTIGVGGGQSSLRGWNKKGFEPQEPGSSLGVAIICMWLKLEPRIPERNQYSGKWTKIVGRE